MVLTTTSVLAYQAVSIALSLGLVVLRVILSIRAALRSRGRRGALVWLSDIFIFVALATIVLGSCISIVRTAKQVSNRRLFRENPQLIVPLVYIPDLLLRLDQLEATLKSLYLEIVSYFISLWFSKMALIVMFFGIRNYMPQRVKWHLYFTASFAFLTFLYLVLTALLRCRPIDSNWSLTNYCTPLTQDTIWICLVMTVVLDLAIFSLPVCLIKTLKLPASLALALRLSMVLLLASTAAAIVRSAITFNFAKLYDGSTTKGLGVNELARLELFGAIQLVLALGTACLPQIRMHLCARKKVHDCDTHCGSANHDKEILGLLPPDVGNSVIMKTVALEIRVDRAEAESVTGLNNWTKEMREETWGWRGDGEHVGPPQSLLEGTSTHERRGS